MNSQVISPARAFVRMGVQATISYPLSALLAQLGTLTAVVIYFFFSRIIEHGSDVGNDYLTFSTLGLIGQLLLAAAFQGIGNELDYAIQQGRLEMLLIEPLPWAMIPVGLALWPALLGMLQAVVVFGIGLALGVHIVYANLIAGIAFALLGVLAGLVFGVLAGSIRVLSKRSDPIWLLYNLVAAIAAGTTLPINILPTPVRCLAWVVPTMYVNAGMRKVLMPSGGAVYGPPAIVGAGALVLLVVVGGPIALWLFNRSLNAGRRLGVLAGY